MATVTLTTATGYVFNYAMPADQLRAFLALAAEVLGDGETLTFVREAA